MNLRLKHSSQSQWLTKLLLYMGCDLLSSQLLPSCRLRSSSSWPHFPPINITAHSKEYRAHFIERLLILSNCRAMWELGLEKVSKCMYNTVKNKFRNKCQGSTTSGWARKEPNPLSSVAVGSWGWYFAKNVIKFTLTDWILVSWLQIIPFQYPLISFLYCVSFLYWIQQCLLYNKGQTTRLPSPQHDQGPCCRWDVWRWEAFLFCSGSQTEQ